MVKYRKYKNISTVVDGIQFHSKGEAHRYLDLKLMEKAGCISNLELQPKFPFVIDGKPVKIRSTGYPGGRACSYYADFKYIEDGEEVIEDFKGMDTPISRLKRALVEAIYGIEVFITKRPSSRAGRS